VPEGRACGRALAVVDDGVSRNGTFVAGERVVGRRRQQDSEGDLAASVTDAQRRVLIALCRLFKGRRQLRDAGHQPANRVGAPAHRGRRQAHLRALFKTFRIDELPQQEKRLRLVALAFSSGLVSDRDR
jgi:hypothetical protein